MKLQLTMLFALAFYFVAATTFAGALAGLLDLGS